MTRCHHRTSRHGDRGRSAGAVLLRVRAELREPGEPAQRAEGHELPRHPRARLRARLHDWRARSLGRRHREPRRGRRGLADLQVGYHPVVAVFAALVAGALLGGFNGFVVTSLRVPSLIATLGTAAIARGVLAFMITPRRGRLRRALAKGGSLGLPAAPRSACSISVLVPGSPRSGGRLCPAGVDAHRSAHDCDRRGR